MSSDEVKTRELELIEQFRNGREQAFDELVMLSSAKLYRVAYALLGNRQDAEEVVQDAFVRAYRALPRPVTRGETEKEQQASFRGDCSFETWMHRITVNLAKNRFLWNRRRGEGVNVSMSEPVSDEEGGGDRTLDFPDMRQIPDKLLEDTETQSCIIRELHALPESLRETMILRHLDDMPYEEIARQLDCKVGTVKSRLARGRDLLRASLTAHEEGKLVN